MRKRSRKLTFSCLVAFCTASIGAANAQPAVANAVSRKSTDGVFISPRWSIQPKIAHHQHLLGPAVLARTEASRPKPIPPVVLPQDLRALMEARQKMLTDPAAASIFTDDALILDLPNGSRWVSGREQVSSAARNYTPDTHFIPISYSESGQNGYIAGVVRTGASTVDEMNFILVARKDQSGVWRIAAESATFIPPPEIPGLITAASLIQNMNENKIEKAVLLSLGYVFGRSDKESSGEYEKVKAENNWNLAEAAKYPGRLVVFCGVNPLRDYAIEEMRRCSRLPLVKGMKLHFANSRIDVKDPAQLAKLQEFFREANRLKLALVIHAWVPGDYGQAQSHIFLDKLLPEAPDVVVQIAHLAGAGPGYGPDDALAVFADAISHHDPRTRNLYFDVATVVPEGTSKSTAALVARRIRQIGLHRILFGSDMMTHSNPPPGEQWATFRRLVPISDRELQTIADNVAPYMR